MRILVIITIILSCTIFQGHAQEAETAFHKAANSYVKGNTLEAANTLAAALQKYPDDPKLNSLLEKLKKEEQENKEENKENEDQPNQEENKDKKEQEGQQEEENKEGQQNQEEKGEEQEKGEEKEEEKGKEDKGKEDKEGKDKGEEKEKGEEGEQEEMRSRQERLQKMNLTEEKAKMILEAMRNNEIQYIQQNKRKVRENSGYGKPDW